MHVHSIILARRWRNLKTGATASVFGALPYHSDADKAGWVTETIGYTFLWSNNRVHCPGGPVATIGEAEERANAINAARRAQLEQHARIYPKTAGRCAYDAAAIPTF